MMIWFDGALGTPIAVRTNPRTITILVKLVIRSTIEGATVKSVMTMTICTATLICAGCSLPSRLIVRRSGSGPWAAAGAVAGAAACANRSRRRREQEGPLRARAVRAG